MLLIFGRSPSDIGLGYWAQWGFCPSPSGLRLLYRREESVVVGEILCLFPGEASSLPAQLRNQGGLSLVNFPAPELSGRH